MVSTTSFKQKLKANSFLITITLYLAFVYYVFTQMYWPNYIERNNGSMIFMGIFHTIFGLMLWSYLTVVFTDPGQVPLYWGFYLDAPEHKKRRYCLICHIFKPERCHHCSTCNRCVLNMDHHCPWINNCIGFYNRKFFILLLFYVCLTVFLVIFGMSPGVINIVKGLMDKETRGQYVNAKDITILGVFALQLILFVMKANFFKFHVWLVSENMTTIENMNKERSGYNPLFNMGSYYNWVQVFGTKKLLWPFPIFLDAGKPVGDGVVWPTRQEAIEMTEDLPADSSEQNLVDENKSQDFFFNEQTERNSGDKKPILSEQPQN